MCLAVPMQIVKVDGNRAVVESQGVETTIALDLVDDAKPGDYVIVHAGFAIQKLEEDEAKETLAIFERLEQSWEAS